MGRLKLAFTGLQTRLEMRALGYGTSEIWGAMRHLDTDKIEKAAAIAGPEAVAKLASVPEADGDHPILDWLKEFFESPLGKALLQALIALLLAA